MSWGVEPGQVYAIERKFTLIVLSGPANGYLWRCMVIDHAGLLKRDWDIFSYTFDFLNRQCERIA